jgi:hypothetical protein
MCPLRQIYEFLRTPLSCCLPCSVDQLNATDRRFLEDPPRLLDFVTDTWSQRPVLAPSLSAMHPFVSR